MCILHWWLVEYAPDTFQASRRHRKKLLGGDNTWLDYTEIC